MSETPARTRKQEWHWLPPVPLDLDDSVYFAWPPRPIALVRHLLGTGYLLSTHSLYILLAIASWAILGPAERWATFEFDWIAQTYLINFGLVVVIGGGDTGSDCVGTSNRHGAASVTHQDGTP